VRRWLDVLYRRRVHGDVRGSSWGSDWRCGFISRERLASPDHTLSILIAGDPLVDELIFEGLEGFITKKRKLELERPIGDTFMTLEKCERLFQHLVECHGHPPCVVIVLCVSHNAAYRRNSAQLCRYIGLPV
jgi:hypothetical protein